MDKHTAVTEWLFACPLISNVGFNFGIADATNTILAPVTAIKDTLAEEYIDGTALRYYDFAILRFHDYSNEPNEVENIVDLLDVEGVAKWIEEQNESRNYPDFEESISEISVLTDSGSIASVDDDTAKYMIQVRIEYIANS